MFDNIPDELKQLKQWVNWRYEDRGQKKKTKTPYQSNSGILADVTYAAHYATFQEACNNPFYDGIGFCLTPNDPYCFVDFDETDNPDFLELQKEIFYSLDSYSEFSPSGKGLHIICKAAVLKGIKTSAVEIYTVSRYMTMTGNVYLNNPIRDTQEAINQFWTRLQAGRSVNAPIVGNDYSIDQKKSDLDIYNIAKDADNGEKFLKLWNGDIETYHYGDHSRADFAIVDILAFYTQNREQIKRLFRLSGLGQRTKAQREDYVDTMITRSFDRVLPEIDVSQAVAKMLQTVTGEPNPFHVHPEATVKQKYGTKLKDFTCAFPTPPGLLGDIAKFIYDQSYKPVPEIAITGAVGMLAGIVGRAYNVSNTGLNCYLLLLAGTGRGKEEIARGTGKLIRAVQTQMPTITDFLGPGDLASGQGLLRYMSGHPTKSFCSIFGEFGIRLKSISNPKGLSSDLMLQKVMLDMFSKSGRADVLSETAYSDAEKNTKPIYSPAFSMIGESSPDWFYHHIDEQMILSGLLPRFTLVEYNGKRPPSNYISSSIIPERQLIEGVCNVATSAYKLLQANQAYEIPFDVNAEKLSRGFDQKCDDMINTNYQNVTAELWNRAHLKTMRIAALVAVGLNPFNPIISRECWDWAELFITHGISALMAKFNNGEIAKENMSDEEQQNKITLEYCVKYLLSDSHEISRLDLPLKMLAEHVVPYTYFIKKLYKLRSFKVDRLGPSVAIKRTLQVLCDKGDLQELPKMQVARDYDYHGRCFLIRSTWAINEFIKHRKN